MLLNLEYIRCQYIRSKGSTFLSRTNVASVGRVFNNTRKVKVISLPETIKEKIDISSEGPSSGVSSGGRGKTKMVVSGGRGKTKMMVVPHC